MFIVILKDPFWEKPIFLGPVTASKKNNPESNSQEIIGKRIPIGHLIHARLCHVLNLVVLGRGGEDVEEALARVADLEHAGHVTAAIAVVGRAPDGAEPVVVEDLVPFLAELVRPEDVAHVVDGQELLHHLRAEGVAGAAWG